MTAEKTQHTKEWTPSTHSTVPQPAGKDCADWYTRAQPTAEDILYALAHTKGQRDDLLSALEAYVNGDVCAHKTSGSPHSPKHLARYAAARTALSKARQA